MVVYPYFRARYKTGNGYNLSQHAPDATMHYTTGQVHKITYRQSMFLHKMLSRTFGYFVRLDDKVGLFTGDDSGIRLNHLYEIKFIKAAGFGMVVAKGIGDPDTMRIDRMVQVFAHLALPGQQNTSIGIGFRSATSGNIGDIRVPVGSDKAGDLLFRSIGHSKN